MKVLWIMLRMPANSPFKFLSSVLHVKIACYNKKNNQAMMKESYLCFAYLILLVLTDQVLLLLSHQLEL